MEVMAGSPSLLVTHSVQPRLLMKLRICLIAYSSSEFFLWQRYLQESLCHHVHYAQDRRPRILRHGLVLNVAGGWLRPREWSRSRSGFEPPLARPNCESAMRLDTFPSDMQGTSPPEECASPRAALFPTMFPQDRRASAKHLESLPRGAWHLG